jgi:hypothetical protein
MTCPKCNAEQPDTAKFCSQCAAPLAAPSQTVAVKSRIPTWLVIVLVLGLAYIGVAVWNITQENDRLRRNASTAPPVVTYEPPRPQLHSVNLTNGASTVNASSFSWYTFNVPVGANSVAISGHFSATGGSGNDIECYILDEDGLANLKNGHPSSTYFNSGKVTQARIGAANLPPGTYYIVLDNRFSLLTPKAVQINATLSYMQ